MLNLQQNQIGAAGGAAIGEVLKTNTMLTELNLSQNQIGVAGGKAIGKGLKGNTTLMELDLASNRIGTKKVAMLKSAAQVRQGTLNLSLQYQRSFW